MTDYYLKGYNDYWLALRHSSPQDEEEREQYWKGWLDAQERCWAETQRMIKEREEKKNVERK